MCPLLSPLLASCGLLGPREVSRWCTGVNGGVCIFVWVFLECPSMFQAWLVFFFSVLCGCVTFVRVYDFRWALQRPPQQVPRSSRIYYFWCLIILVLFFALFRRGGRRCPSTRGRHRRRTMTRTPVAWCLQRPSLLCIR